MAFTKYVGGTYGHCRGKICTMCFNPLNLSVPYLFFYLSHARQKVDVGESRWTSLSQHVSNIELYT